MKCSNNLKHNNDVRYEKRCVLSNCKDYCKTNRKNRKRKKQYVIRTDSTTGSSHHRSFNNKVCKMLHHGNTENHRKSPKITGKITENHQWNHRKSQENHRFFIKKLLFFAILLYNIYGYFIFTITLLMRRTKMEYYLEVEN